tara:strand:- start:217 stop:702 length:486 start_codon:yes stop_codon:yes gene_type:complete
LVSSIFGDFILSWEHVHDSFWIGSKSGSCRKEPAVTIVSLFGYLDIDVWSSGWTPKGSTWLNLRWSLPLDTWGFLSIFVGGDLTGKLAVGSLEFIVEDGVVGAEGWVNEFSTNKVGGNKVGINSVSFLFLESIVVTAAGWSSRGGFVSNSKSIGGGQEACN